MMNTRTKICTSCHEEKEEREFKLRRGDVLMHKLGFKVIVLINLNGGDNTGVQMIKCRFLDNDGMLHVHEFFIQEMMEVEPGANKV